MFGSLIDRLQLVFDWYRGMVDPGTGDLVYLYDPEEGEPIVDGSPIRDIGSVWDVGVLSDFLGRDELRVAIERWLDRFSALVVRRDCHAVFVPRDEPATIAHNAFMVLALARSRGSERARQLLPLSEGILHQQRRDGSYRISFEQEPDSGEEFYPAEAMLALLEVYRLTGDARLLESVERAFRYYRAEFYDGGRLSPELLVFFANWQSQAGRLLFESTRRTDTRRFVARYLGELHDRIAESGFYDDLARFPFSQACVEVACALEGVSDGFAVAASAGHGRAEAYRGYAQRAASFLLAAQRTADCAPRERGGFGQSLEDRRQRIDLTGHAASGFIKCLQHGVVRPEKPLGTARERRAMAAAADVMTLALCGDVMTGRGIDQALPFHCDPELHEGYITDARGYVLLAEQAHGSFRRPLAFAELWGEALEEFELARPDLRLVNLETSITTSDEYWPDKGINYRMHPGNLPCLTAAGIQCCCLANNHVLDWGYAGLRETLGSLEKAGMRGVGAGRNLLEAQAPAAFGMAKGRRLLVFGLGAWTSGIPFEWAAGVDRPGVNFLPDLSSATADSIGERIRQARQPGDLVVVSIHWGSNWGFEVKREEAAFAHRLIDSGAVDVLHGHSSHHVRGIEVYRRKLVLYGCGDFLDDYEGISGQEAFRADLGLLYLARLEAESGVLAGLEMVPTAVRQFRVVRAGPEDARWLRDTLEQEGRGFGTRAELTAKGRLQLQWG